MLNIITALAYIPSVVKIGSDVQADIKSPSEENLNMTVQDAEDFAKRLFPNVDPARLDAGAGIALCAITLESKHDLKAVVIVTDTITLHLETLLNLPPEAKAEVEGVRLALEALAPYLVK